MISMQIEYPQQLVDQVEAAIKDRPLMGFVPGAGPNHPAVMLVGEAPGRSETDSRVPFSGTSGKELIKLLEEIGLSRATVHITSVVRKRPYLVKVVTDKKTGQRVTKYPNRTPTKKEVLAFGPLFDWELKTVTPQVVVPLGNTSLQRLLGPEAKIGDLHGQVLHQSVLETRSDHQGYQMGTTPYYIVPMYHPAAFLYARRLEPTVRADWQAFGKWLKEQHLMPQ